MLIREVILENFMSYEYARVQLRPGVNVVVGPNGAGKSGFLLGICIGLGETYTERSKRLSDLIRWGQDQARISLLLDNSTGKNGQRPIPQFDSDIIRLSRSIRRDGKYSFELNQKGAQKFEVVEILRKLGFDPDNMLIIMHQSMPESFANLSTQEKLKTLEEAVGYQSFRADVVEAKRKLSGILSEEESINQLLDRARETLNYWREQNSQLQEKRNLQTRAQFLQREMAWSRVAELEKNMSRLSQELDRADGELYDAEAEMEKYGKMVIDTERQLGAHRAEWSDLLEKRIGYERTVGACEYAITALKERSTQVDRMLVSSDERRRQFEARAQALRSKLRAGVTTLDDYFSIFSEIEKTQTETYETLHSEFKAQQADVERQHDSLANQLGEAEAGVSSVTEEMEIMRARIDEVNDRYVEARIQMALLKDRRGRLQRSIDDVKGDIDRCRTDMKAAEADALIRGPRVDTGRSSDEILGDIRKTSGILLGLANVSDEAEAMYESYSRTFNELKERAEQVRQSRLKVMEEIDERMKKWLDVTRNLLDQVNGRYKSLLLRLQATGDVRLDSHSDIEESGLELYVGFKGATPALLDPYLHSGGERSTAVMAFLLSLQQNVLSPFRAVDEFDLHMDPKNREIVSDFIVSTLEGSTDQYLVITPSQVTFRGRDAHIIMINKTEGLSAVSLVQ